MGEFFVGGGGLVLCVFFLFFFEGIILKCTKSEVFHCLVPEELANKERFVFFKSIPFFGGVNSLLNSCVTDFFACELLDFGSYSMPSCHLLRFLYGIACWPKECWSNYSDLTRPHHPNGGLVREIPLFQGNPGWGNIIVWPERMQVTCSPGGDVTCIPGRGVDWIT